MSRKPARTNFTNHDRVTPESNFSSKAGIAETVAIGEKSGLVPVVTHMKVAGPRAGHAPAQVLASMAQATRRGHYTAADAYPYLAGQIRSRLADHSRLGAGRRPRGDAEAIRRSGVARAHHQGSRGGDDRALRRPAGRVSAAHAAGADRGDEGDERGRRRNGRCASSSRAAIRARSSASARRRISIKILQDPSTSMACDCGASTATRVHPRFYGSFPRVLGRYVREQKIMSWEQAIRKSSWLPAATIGMSDRGLIALGMAADITVFDPNTIIDHATYENPALPSEGVRHVLVNGVSR